MASRLIGRGNVGEVIRQARIKQGITQVDLSVRMGYKPESLGISVRKWETGKALPPLDKIRDLAAILDVPIDALIP